MRLSPIVLKLRLDQITGIENYVAGAAELNAAISQTLTHEMAFVIPLIDNAGINNFDSGINQRLTERFGIVVALKNDSSDREKTGIVAYDRLHDIRDEIFSSIVGWDLGYDSLVYYRGGRMIDMNPAWLWWQFEFEFGSRIVSNTDGITSIEERTVDDRQQVSQIPDFNKIYANVILAPSADLPYTGDLPLADGYPDVTLPDMALWIDETDNPYLGAFGRGFGSGFNFYDEDGGN